jgi:hypothetical protein
MDPISVSLYQEGCIISLPLPDRLAKFDVLE